MSPNFFDYPPEERKHMAVRHYKRVLGSEKIFNKLIKRLNLTEKEFIAEYGDKIIGNPTCLDHEIVMMIREDFRSVKKNE